jgi:hypothetical protein
MSRFAVAVFTSLFSLSSSHFAERQREEGRERERPNETERESELS